MASLRCRLDQATGDLLVYGEIGSPDGGLTADELVPALSDVRTDRITLRVNSLGGSVFDGMAIYNALLAHPAEVVAYVDGIAASAASFIVQAADQRLMRSASQMMIHNASGMAYGTSVEMRQLAEILDDVSATIAGIYATRSGTPVSGWRAAMSAETWYGPDAAVEAGLADAVVVPASTQGVTASGRDQLIRARARTLRRGRDADH